MEIVDLNYEKAEIDERTNSDIHGCIGHLILLLLYDITVK